jgi:hypothetical protein
MQTPLYPRDHSLLAALRARWRALRLVRAQRHVRRAFTPAFAPRPLIIGGRPPRRRTTRRM